VNRRDFERHLKSHGCFLHHHGTKHDVWMNPRTLACVPVPRHRTLKGARAGASAGSSAYGS